MSLRDDAFLEAYDNTFAGIRKALSSVCELNGLADDQATKEILRTVYIALSNANRAMYDITDIPI